MCWVLVISTRFRFKLNHRHGSDGQCRVSFVVVVVRSLGDYTAAVARWPRPVAPRILYRNPLHYGGLAPLSFSSTPVLVVRWGLTVQNLIMSYPKENYPSNGLSRHLQPLPHVQAKLCQVLLAFILK